MAIIEFLINNGADLSGRTKDGATPLHLAVIYGWLPAVLKILAGALMWGYPLTAERQQAINRRLQRR